MSVAGAPIARLRLSFAALSAVLLLAVGAVLHAAVVRLDEQRQLRHRMVAERVFDEVEREIGSLLQHEVERPSSAYDTNDTDPARWSPFVVGYYFRDPELNVVALPRLAADRAARVREAIAAMQPQLDAARVVPAAVAAADPDHGQLAQPSSPDVLRQLNRSVKVRERRQHDLTANLIVLSVGRTTLIVERQSRDAARREGFVLDIPKLVSTIQAWVLSAQGLGSVAVLSTGASLPRASKLDYEFSHQLAAPLDSQRVYLRLSQLDDQDASNTLYGLAALLGTAALLGMGALYRMVAVQVRFAERRNNFVSAVTHELKTPLTSIRMYAEMLRDGMVQDATTRQEYYATITSEGERLTRLINNVLEHAELRNGRRRAHLMRADVGRVVGDVLELMRPHVEREGFALTLRLDVPLPNVQLDVDAFKQVLFNIIDNALKYGRSAEACRIEVTCKAAEAGVVVGIRDFGPGVAAEQLELIFDPFFRGENELTRRQKGTGIGLSLVRDLVQLMNGRVHAIAHAPGLEVQLTLTA